MPESLRRVALDPLPDPTEDPACEPISTRLCKNSAGLILFPPKPLLAKLGWKHRQEIWCYVRAGVMILQARSPFGFSPAVLAIAAAPPDRERVPE